MPALSLLDYGIDLIGKKWSKEIIYILRDGPLRFSQLRYKIPACSVKVLSEVLDHLEKNKLVVRTQYPEVPLKVVYELSKSGVFFVDVIILYRTVARNHIYENRDVYIDFHPSPTNPKD